MVQHDFPMRHGFRKLSAKGSLENGHLAAGGGEVLGKIFVMQAQEVHFAFRIKTEGGAFAAKLDEAILGSQI